MKTIGIAYLIVIGISIAGCVGWVMNIVTVVHTCCAPVTGMLVVRVIGIFVPPLGAVIGFF